jgi:hypothetical protein
VELSRLESTEKIFELLVTAFFAGGGFGFLACKVLWGWGLLCGVEGFAAIAICENRDTRRAGGI